MEIKIGDPVAVWYRQYSYQDHFLTEGKVTGVTDDYLHVQFLNSSLWVQRRLSFWQRVFGPIPNTYLQDKVTK